MLSFPWEGQKITTMLLLKNPTNLFWFFLTFSKYLNMLEWRRTPYFSRPLALSSSISSSRSMQLFICFSSAFPPLNLSVEQNKESMKQSSNFHIVAAFRTPCGLLLVSITQKITSTWLQSMELEEGVLVHVLRYSGTTLKLSHSLLWMTICSSFLLAEALSRIFWSMVLAVTRRYTTTGLVCPMRWQRSWACRSAWGFWEGKEASPHTD